MKCFILTNVVPNICKKIPNSAAFVFGKAILWLLFSPSADNFCIPAEYMSRIKQLLNGLRDMGEEGDDLSPIVRVPVLVTGDEGTVYIDIMPNEEEEAGNSNRSRWWPWKPWDSKSDVSNSAGNEPTTQL